MFYYAQVDNTDRTQTFRATSKYAVVFKTDDGELRVCFQHHNIEKLILKKRTLNVHVFVQIIIGKTKLLRKRWRYLPNIL